MGHVTLKVPKGARKVTSGEMTVQAGRDGTVTVPHIVAGDFIACGCDAGESKMRERKSWAEEIAAADYGALGAFLLVRGRPLPSVPRHPREPEPDHRDVDAHNAWLARMAPTRLPTLEELREIAMGVAKEWGDI